MNVRDIYGANARESARDFERAASTQLLFFCVTLSWDKRRQLPLSREITFALAGRALEGVRR